MKHPIPAILFAILSSAALLSCHDTSTEICTQFKYDERTGSCKDCSGKPGFNSVDFDVIRKTKNAECLTLHKTEMILLLHDTANRSHLGYETLEGYNFKGSIFDSCQLFFNFIRKSDFRGADLRTLQYGYAEVIGLTDNYTKIPIKGTVTVMHDSVYCYN